MTKLTIITRIFLVCVSIAVGYRMPAQNANDSIALSKMKEIRSALHNLILVNRFESIETPCMILNNCDSSIATRLAINNQINGDYRIQLFNGIPSPNGIKCLSEYCCRYMRLLIDSINVAALKMSGKIESTYGYPSSSLMQYLGMTINEPGRDSVFFKKLVHNTGRFEIYPEDNRYKIRLFFPLPPHSGDFTIYGYIEAVKPMQAINDTVVYNIYFDQMDIRRGDDNNRIFLKFSGTTHYDEQLYFTALIKNVLKKAAITQITAERTKGDSTYNLGKSKSSYEKLKNSQYALWLANFLRAAPYCKIFGNPLGILLSKPSFELPNTSPIPAK